MATPVRPDPLVETEITARRATGGIFVGVVLATCGVFAAVTMAPIVAYDITGSAFLAGLPVAALLAGAGLGAARVTAAALGSGLLLGLVGFAGVNLLAGGVLVVPLAVIVVRRGVATPVQVRHP